VALSPLVGGLLGAIDWRLAFLVPAVVAVGFFCAALFMWLEQRTPTVPGEANYTGRTTTNSGRVTSLAIGSTCNMGNCVLFVGAAGGGVWKTANALDNAPSWLHWPGHWGDTMPGFLPLDARSVSPLAALVRITSENVATPELAVAVSAHQDALAHLHEIGVVFRDFSLANVIETPDGGLAQQLDRSVRLKAIGFFD